MTEKLSESEYLSILKNYEADAETNRSQINKRARFTLRRYKRELYGNESPERSKYVSNDVQDVVEADMPSLARTFLGAKKPVIFEPTSNDPANVQEARDKTEFIDWVVRKQPDSYRTQYGFLKDTELQPYAALKFFVEEETDTQEHVREDISFPELAEIQESLKGENVEKVEIVERSEIRNVDTPFEGAQERLDVTFKVTSTKRVPKVCGVPIENLLISRGSRDEQDANLVGERHRKTRGELLQEGYSMEEINKIPTHGNQTTMDTIRWEGGRPASGSFGDWAAQELLIYDYLVKIDKDGDGTREIRHIVKSNDVILLDEPFELINYVVTSGILMPHSVEGISRGELTEPTAELKTALIRGVLDNSYSHNAPQVGVNENVNYDDLLTKRPNGIVRTSGKENPGQSIFPFNVEYIGDKALQVVQYADQARAQTTGNLLASQGLSADQFEKETATRFEGVQEEGKAKIELVARTISETAYIRLYSGLSKLLSIYQTTEVEIMVLGRPLKTKPANWKFEHSVRSTVGLGAGDGEKSSDVLTGVLSLQRSLLQEGSPLVDQEKIYNTIDALMQSLDIHSVNQFFNNPDRPEQLIIRQNELLQAAVQQLQAELQQIQNPLTESEQIRAQAKLIEAQAKQQLEVAKLSENARQFNIKTEQSNKQHNQNTAVSLTKIEADTNKDIPGSMI